jgi:hypothetical protein
MTIPAHRIPAFWEKVDRASDDGCWEWLGAKNGGYGRFHLRSQGPGRATAAHRVSYELLVGPIPDGLTLDHLCRNRGCVNPAHLEPVTNKTNILRGESFSADHARRTHCPHGHEYTPENTYWRTGKRTGRECRECHRRWGAEHRAKRKAERSAV